MDGAARIAIRGGLPLAILALLLVAGIPTPTMEVAGTSATPGWAAAELPASPTPLGSTAPVNTTLAVNGSSVNLSGQFFGSTVNNEVRMFRGESDALNATPAKVLVWPGAMAGEDYDPFTETHYNTYNGTATRALTTEAQFVALCEAIHCTAILQVPAEINDPSFAEEIVNYTEVNLSFVPAYWMIGNEPELWTHWNVAWKNWGTHTTTGPNPTQFGNEVVDYVNAIRNVDNTTPILGLPASGCTCGYYTFDQWIAGVLKVTGSKIQAVAFHEYPAGWLGTGNGSLQAFYGTLQGSASIPVRMLAARQAVASACPGCNVSVFISELGSALSWSAYGPYAIGFSGALSIASQITQGMASNVSNIDLFAAELATTNSWFSPTGNPRPDYGLYTGIFDHLGTQAFSVNFTGLGRTLYGIDTIAPNDQGRRDLLVVNDNLTHAINFAPQFAEDAGSAPVEVWVWNGSVHTGPHNHTNWVEPFTPTPLPEEFPYGLPANFTLPRQSLVLFESYPSGASYVRVNESGVPAPSAWYASVGGTFYTTTADNLSLLLPPGAYPVASVGIPLPIGGKEYNPSERLGPFVPSPLVVEGTHANTTIDFVDQWRVNLTASPLAGGSVTPDVGWWNASAPLALTPVPATGYAFVGWTGWGPGSYNGTNPFITVTPTGRIIEKARFVAGNEVEIVEQGLPYGTPWSVTVRGFSTSSTTNVLTLYEPDGSFGFSVSPVPGYRILPQNGGFTVSGPSTLVHVQFVELTPPPPVYPVTFNVTGLPGWASTTVTVRGSTQYTVPEDPVFDLSNGSYGYQIGFVNGYHADVQNRSFEVHGGPLTVDLPFVPTVYRVTWEATGTRAGLNWSVEVAGQPVVATSAWVSVWLPNGTYPYLIDLPQNFTTTLRSGYFTVSGDGALITPAFSLALFAMEFHASGADGAPPWSVRLGNTTVSATTDRSDFLAANGTYTFDVHSPPGYYAVPSHGTVTVAGASAPIEIQFLPSSNRPSAALVAALTFGALEVSAWITGTAVLGFIGLRRLRRPPAPPTAPSRRSGRSGPQTPPRAPPPGDARR